LGHSKTIAIGLFQVIWYFFAASLHFDERIGIFVHLNFATLYLI